jgi:type IV pilus assembly protein PilX
MNSVRNQSGAALVVGLIFLVILTLLGITAMQTGILEERMAGNSRDRNIAFQAAEAALRDGEKDTQCKSSGRSIGCISGMTGADQYCTEGLCCQVGTSGLTCVDPPAPGFYTQLPTTLHSVASGSGVTVYEGSVPYGHYTGAAALPVPKQPNYIIEPYRSQGSNYYRISALGFGQNSSTTVTLQEVYKE